MTNAVSQIKYADDLSGRLNPIFKAILEEINELASLEDNWDCEGASVIDRASILRAQKFIYYLSSVWVNCESVGDHAPAVFPTIDGGIQLYWKINCDQISLDFRPSKNNIQFMEKQFGKEKILKSVSVNEAGDIAIRAIQKAG